MERGSATHLFPKVFAPLKTAISRGRRVSLRNAERGVGRYEGRLVPETRDRIAIQTNMLAQAASSDFRAPSSRVPPLSPLGIERQRAPVNPSPFGGNTAKGQRLTRLCVVFRLEEISFKIRRHTRLLLEWIVNGRIREVRPHSRRHSCVHPFTEDPASTLVTK